MDFAQLPVYPGLAALCVGAATPGGLQAGQQRGIHQAIGQCLPDFDLGTLAALAGDELANRRQGVEVFNNHAGVKHRLATLHDQAGDLAQRVGRPNRGAGCPGIFQDMLVVELFLGHHDPYFSHIGAGIGSDEFHNDRMGSMGMAAFR